MDYFALLEKRLPRLEKQRYLDFSKHTTIGCGGVAQAVVYPANTEEAAQLLWLLHCERVPYYILGAGANVLPPEVEYEGVVVRFSKLNGLYADGKRLYAGAGVTGGVLCRFAQEKRLSGFEPFIGIPMTVGGGTAMNAGIQEAHFADVVERVVAVERGRVCTLSLQDCRYGEKDSIFLSGIAVLGVYLKGTPSCAENIAQRMCYFQTHREKLPRGRSMGCVFVNPKGCSAGKIIDECGLKGLRVGGAVVAQEHANFIINEGGTADDVASLVDLVKQKVFQERGIALREEIRRIFPAGN